MSLLVVRRSPLLEKAQKKLPVLGTCVFIVLFYVFHTSSHCLPLLRDAATVREGVEELSLFTFLATMTVVCFAKSILVHPGTVPGDVESVWANTSLSSEVNVQERKQSGMRRWCKWCGTYKPDRCHHCRKCNLCVLRMDHHCPLLDTCLGFQNHKYFVLLLLYSTLACHMMFWNLFQNWRVSSWSTTLLGGVVACATVFLSMFLAFHFVLAVKGLTTIEYLEKPKLDCDRPLFNRGILGNLKATFGDNVLLWLLPCSPPAGDGFTFVSEEMKLARKTLTHAVRLYSNPDEIKRDL